MAMFKPSQSHSGGVTVNPYTGNIAQELQLLTEKTGKKKPNPILRVDCHRQPSYNLRVVFGTRNQVTERQNGFIIRLNLNRFNYIIKPSGNCCICIRSVNFSFFPFHFISSQLFHWFAGFRQNNVNQIPE